MGHISNDCILTYNYSTTSRAQGISPLWQSDACNPLSLFCLLISSPVIKGPHTPASPPNPAQLPDLEKLKVRPCTNLIEGKCSRLELGWLMGSGTSINA